MASLEVLCFNPFKLKNKIMKIEHKKIFCDPSKILKNISWPISICLNYFMAPTKTLRPPSCILNVQFLRPATLLKKRLWHGCFPLNFVKFLRTPFLQNTSGRLLLNAGDKKSVIISVASWKFPENGCRYWTE